MVRVKIKGTGIRAKSNPNEEPDFWKAIQWLSDASEPKNNRISNSSVLEENIAVDTPMTDETTKTSCNRKGAIPVRSSPKDEQDHFCTLPAIEAIRMTLAESSSWSSMPTAIPIKNSRSSSLIGNGTRKLHEGSVLKGKMQEQVQGSFIEDWCKSSCGIHDHEQAQGSFIEDWGKSFCGIPDHGCRSQYPTSTEQDFDNISLLDDVDMDYLMREVLEYSDKTLADFLDEL
jgi:hypothetical protein